MVMSQFGYAHAAAADWHDAVDRCHVAGRKRHADAGLECIEKTVGSIDGLGEQGEVDFRAEVFGKGPDRIQGNRGCCNKSQKCAERCSEAEVERKSFPQVHVSSLEWPGLTPGDTFETSRSLARRQVSQSKSKKP